MNIAIINADSIFWTADKNIRLVNFNFILSKIYNISKPDQIYLVGGFEPNDPFNETLKEIIQANMDKPIIPVPSTNAIDGHHNPESILIDLLYRGALSQEDVMTTRFTVVSADAASIRAARFLAKKGLIEPVSYILSDSLENFDEAARRVDVKDTISLKAENRSSEDKFVIRNILELVKKDAEKEIPFYNTASVLIGKCKSFFSFSPMNTRTMMLSLIHNGYLKRQKFTNRSGEQRNGIVLGEKAESMLSELSPAKE